MSQPLATYHLEPQQLLNQLPNFVRPLLALAEDIGLDLSLFQADHIALRINDIELAKAAHNAWLDYGVELSSATVNGRPIIIIKLDKPIEIADWIIDCIELPYPAEGKVYPKQGWEHIEFVVPSKATTADDYLQDIRQKLSQLDEKWDGLMSRGITTKLSSPKGEGERLSNPTIAFKRSGICIKLHPFSLEQVIKSEKK